MIEQHHDERQSEQHAPRGAQQHARGQRQLRQYPAQVINVEGDVSGLVVQNLRAHSAHRRVVDAVVEHAEVPPGNNLRGEQHHQLLVQPKDPSQEDETTIGPMTREQWGFQPVQNLRHPARVLLFLLDEQVNGPGVSVITGRVGRRAQMTPFPALADLESLQRADEWFEKRCRNIDLVTPRDGAVEFAVAFKMFEPVFHGMQLSCSVEFRDCSHRSTEAMVESGVEVPAVSPMVRAPSNQAGRKSAVVWT